MNLDKITSFVRGTLLTAGLMTAVTTSAYWFIRSGEYKTPDRLELRCKIDDQGKGRTITGQLQKFGNKGVETEVLFKDIVYCPEKSHGRREMIRLVNSCYGPWSPEKEAEVMQLRKATLDSCFSQDDVDSFDTRFSKKDRDKLVDGNVSPEYANAFTNHFSVKDIVWLSYADKNLEDYPDNDKFTWRHVSPEIMNEYSTQFSSNTIYTLATMHGISPKRANAYAKIFDIMDLDGDMNSYAHEKLEEELVNTMLLGMTPELVEHYLEVDSLRNPSEIFSSGISPEETRQWDTLYGAHTIAEMKKKGVNRTDAKAFAKLSDDESFALESKRLGISFAEFKSFTTRKTISYWDSDNNNRRVQRNSYVNIIWTPEEISDFKKAGLSSEFVNSYPVELGHCDRMRSNEVIGYWNNRVPPAKVRKMKKTDNPYGGCDGE